MLQWIIVVDKYKEMESAVIKNPDISEEKGPRRGRLIFCNRAIYAYSLLWHSVSISPIPLLLSLFLLPFLVSF
jgi:hypothetical protein